MPNIFPEYKDVKEDIKALMPDGGDEAEAELYEYLKEQLPPEWYVVHNIHFRGDKGENQIDFLVIAPGKGIVNLECKGKSYTFGTNGTFYLGGKTVPSPIGQSRGAIENFHNKMKNEEFGGNHFCVYANAVIYPTKEISESDRQILAGNLPWIFDKNDCQNIRAIIDKVLKLKQDELKNNHKINPSSLTRGNAKKIYDRYSKYVILEEAKQANTTPEKTLETFRNRQIRLSNSQLIHDTNLCMSAVLNYPQSQISQAVMEGNDSTTFNVSGGAGTGKTLIGFAIAEEFLESNPDKKVLYVCYNSCLAAFYDLKRGKKNLEITTFFRLVNHCFTDKIVSKINNIKDWSDRAPEMNELWKDNKNRNSKFVFFDLIIVDEAQDFTGDMLNFISKLRKPEAKIVFFSDVVQNIYVKNPLIEKIGQQKLDILRLNVRNTKPIDEFSCKPIDTLKATATFTGPDVSEQKGDMNALTQKIQEVIVQFEPSQIAVLSDSQDIVDKIKSSSSYSFVTGGSSFRDNKSNLKRWIENDNIWKSTVHAFKGLEAECVIYVKTNNVGSEQTKIDYIGETRAKLQLIVFTLEN